MMHNLFAQPRQEPVLSFQAAFPSAQDNDPNAHLAHKRHLQDAYDSPQHAKRRLIDNLHTLSIGKDGKWGTGTGNFDTSSSTFASPNQRANTLFGTFTKEQLKRPLSNPNRVVISNIDKFLHENPDQLDIIGEKLQFEDLRKAGLNDLAVSCGLDIKKAWNSIISQYKDKAGQHKSIDDLVYKLIWEEYLAKYFSLIKHYNPLKVVWDNYTSWLKKRNRGLYSSPKLMEIRDNVIDDDQMMLDDFDMNTPNADDDFDIDGYDEQAELQMLAAREQSLRDGMSSYGTYYTHDEGWGDNYPPVEDVDDDDIMMED